MRKVRISNGQEVLVDSSDYGRVKLYKWRFVANNYKSNKKIGYAVTGKNLFLHRMLMNPPKGLFVDHINGDKLDNRRCNLRIVTRQQNATNVRKYRKKLSSIYKGVTREKGKKVYRVSISHNGRIVKINGFKTARQAAIAYDLWANDLFGEYAGLNFRRAK